MNCIQNEYIFNADITPILDDICNAYMNELEIDPEYENARRLKEMCKGEVQI